MWRQVGFLHVKVYEQSKAFNRSLQKSLCRFLLDLTPTPYCIGCKGFIETRDLSGSSLAYLLASKMARGMIWLIPAKSPSHIQYLLAVYGHVPCCTPAHPKRRFQCRQTARNSRHHTQPPSAVQMWLIRYLHLRSHPATSHYWLHQLPSCLRRTMVMLFP